MVEIPKAEKPRTQAQMVKDIAAVSEVPVADVRKVVDAMREIILYDLAPSRGRSTRAGSVNVLGLVKIDIREQKKAPARTMRSFGREIQVAAKPAKKRGKVGVRTLKTLKDVL